MCVFYLEPPPLNMGFSCPEGKWGTLKLIFRLLDMACFVSKYVSVVSWMAYNSNFAV